MYPPGLRLRRIRESLGLTYRDVEKASYEIAVKRGRPDFVLHISRLAKKVLRTEQLPGQVNAMLAKRVLANYLGLWRMASSLLFVLGLSILIYSIALSQNRWYLSVLNADRAVELCIAGFIVTMLLFARYYRLRMTNLERQLGPRLLPVFVFLGG